MRFLSPALRRLFAVKAKGLQDRDIVDLEQHGIRFVGPVLMGMDSPWRQREEIALRPIEPLSVDDRRSLSAHDVIDDAARVPVRLAFGTGPQRLDRRAYGQQ